MKNTRAQDLAIKTIDKNVSVNAESWYGQNQSVDGKVYSYIRKWKTRKGKEIESIVAITFTKKPLRR